MLTAHYYTTEKRRENWAWWLRSEGIQSKESITWTMDNKKIGQETTDHVDVSSMLIG